MLVVYCVDVVLLILFRVYLQQANAKRDREQGVHIEPEPRDGDVAIDVRGVEEESTHATEPLDQTDGENRNFRYYL